MTLGVGIFILGVLFQVFYASRQQPSNLVWSVDSSVKVPSDLRRALEKQEPCKNMRGNETITGVGLWGVIQVEEQKFAKIAYGCSLTLTSYIMAIKQGDKWQLLKPVDYFFNTAQGVPSCGVISKYKIPASIETFCINEKSQIVKNPTPQ